MKTFTIREAYMSENHYRVSVEEMKNGVGYFPCRWPSRISYKDSIVEANSPDEALAIFRSRKETEDGS